MSDFRLHLGKNRRVGAGGAAANNRASLGHGLQSDAFPGLLFKCYAALMVVETRMERLQDRSMYEDCPLRTVGAQLLLRSTRQPSVAGSPDQLPHGKVGVCHRPVLMEGRRSLDC